MAKQPKPDCEIGDTLRIEATPGWSGWITARSGDTGKVVRIDRNIVWVLPDSFSDRYERTHGADLLQSWWLDARENQPQFTVIKNVSDEEVAKTRQELKQLLKQL